MSESPMAQQKSLYVGDLHPETTETDLRDTFSQMGQILSVHLCRSAFSGKSLGYAYVNFFSPSDASKAMACLNQTNLKGKAMRIMWCQRDSLKRKSGIGNLFVKNLDSSISGSFLLSLFCPFGTVLSCKVAEEDGKSKGFGFVQFDSEDSAVAARAALHNSLLRGKKLYVTKFVKKTDRTANSEKIKFTNLYVKNLPDNITEGRLAEMFSTFGKICNVAIMKDSEGRSRGFGFVNFQSSQEGSKAVEALNGFSLGKKTLFVARAQTKAERADSLKHNYNNASRFHVGKSKASSLYVGNLNVSVDDNKLRQLFSSFGRLISVRVMRYKNGISKGFGFVCFCSSEEAMTALQKLNGTIFEQRILHIVIAQSKDDGFNTLHNYYACLDTSNYSVISPLDPFYFKFHALNPSPLSRQPIFDEHHDANVRLQYPFETPIYQPYFSSYVPMSRTYLGSTGNTKSGFYKEQFMTCPTSSTLTQGLNNEYCVSLKTGYGKKENKTSDLANSNSKEAATAGLATTASPLITKSTDVPDPLIHKFQPESAASMTGMPLEMDHSQAA